MTREIDWPVASFIGLTANIILFSLLASLSTRQIIEPAHRPMRISLTTFAAPSQQKVQPVSATPKTSRPVPPVEKKPAPSKIVKTRPAIKKPIHAEPAKTEPVQVPSEETAITAEPAKESLSAPSSAPKIYSVDQVTGPPQFIKQGQAKYPESERFRGREAEVIAEIILDQNGIRIATTITKSGGKAFDDAVLKALNDSGFSPASINGDPVSIRVTIPFNFELR